jgi:hypothetical protein
MFFFLLLLVYFLIWPLLAMMYFILFVFLMYSVLPSSMLCVEQKFFELLGVFIIFIKNFLLQQIFNNFSDYSSIYDFFSLFLDN